MGVILDSSVLIAVERGKLNWSRLVQQLSREVPYMSAITLSEIWHGCHRANAASLEKRLKFVQEMQAEIPILAFSKSEALIHAKLWANLEKAGQKIGDHDLIIAATAIAFDYAVATLNEGEFRRIPHLRLIPMKQFLAV